MSPKAELRATGVASIIALLCTLVFYKYERDGTLSSLVFFITLFVIYFVGTGPYFKGAEREEQKALSDIAKNTLRCRGMYLASRTLFRLHEDEPEKIVALLGGLTDQAKEILAKYELEEMPSALELVYQATEYLELINQRGGVKKNKWKPRTFWWKSWETTPRIKYWQEIIRDRPANKEEITEEHEKEAQERILGTLCEVALILSQPMLDKVERDLKQYESENTAGNAPKEGARVDVLSAQVDDCRKFFEQLCRAIYPFEQHVRKHREKLGMIDNKIRQMKMKINGIRKARQNVLENIRQGKGKN